MGDGEGRRGKGGGCARSMNGRTGHFQQRTYVCVYLGCNNSNFFYQKILKI